MKIELDIDPRLYGDYLLLCEMIRRGKELPPPRDRYSEGPTGNLSAVIEEWILRLLQKYKDADRRLGRPFFIHSLENTPLAEAELVALGRAATWEERIRKGCDG